LKIIGTAFLPCDRSRHDVDIGRAIIVREDENIAKFDLLHQRMVGFDYNDTKVVHLII
jgi:hypothetical protein